MLVNFQLASNLVAKSRSKTVPRWLSALAALLAFALLPGREAGALDLNRSLTQYVQRIWQMQQGLPAGSIFSICQATDGFILLGTQTRLVRFDGLRFSDVREIEALDLAELWVQCLQQNNDGTLWIGTHSSGLIRLADGVATRFTVANELPANNVQCLTVDQNGGLWVGTSAGLARFAQGKFTVWRFPELSTDDVRGLCLAANGSIWIGGNSSKITIWDGQQFTQRSVNSLSGAATIQALHCAADKSIWLGTSSGVVQLSGTAERRLALEDGLADDWVLCLAEGQWGAMWIGTRQGFSRVRGNDIDSFRPYHGLSQSTVFSLCEDHEGSLWVGTKNGLNQFSDRRTIPFTMSEGLPSNDAGPILQDQAGTIWVGTAKSGLGQYDDKRFKVLTTEQGLTSNTITALENARGDGDDEQTPELWVGTSQGLNHMRASAEHVYQVDKTYGADAGLPSTAITCLKQDSGGVLWVGTSAGLAALDSDGHFTQPQLDDQPLRAAILALTELRPQVLLVAADDGYVYELRSGQLRPWNAQFLGGRRVDAFFHDADGSLWLGTRGYGLCRWNGTTMRMFTVQDGLYDDEIYGIASDSRQRLWLACSKGIFSLDRDELQQLLSGELSALTSSPFTPTDAQRTIECQLDVQPAVWRMRNGHIWFSTTHGLIVVDPLEMGRKLPPAPVVVEEVVVNGNVKSPSEVDDLPPGASNISFRFTSLSFRAPSRITFRYQLVGFDPDWVDAGTRREAFYTNLPPGHYKLRVAARNIDGEWTELPERVRLGVRPLIYQTWWFWPLCIGAVALAVWLGFRMRVRRIREHLQVIIAERSRIARELHDTLMQGFSGVTMEMQALLPRLGDSPERGTLQEIIRDAATCLTEARRSIAGLRSSGGKRLSLSGSIAAAARQLTETKNVRLRLALDDDCHALSTDVEYNLLRIAQEAITNAVKHASARSIEVVLSCTPRELRLSITDDGIGIVQNGDAAAAGHFGLLGMRERANHIGASVDIESQPAQGTTIRVLLSLGVQTNSKLVKEAAQRGGN